MQSTCSNDSTFPLRRHENRPRGRSIGLGSPLLYISDRYGRHDRAFSAASVACYPEQAAKEMGSPIVAVHRASSLPRGKKLPLGTLLGSAAAPRPYYAPAPVYVAPPPVVYEGGRLGVSKTFDHAHAEPYREAMLPVRQFQGAVPSGGVDTDRQDFDAMVARIAHDLRRWVKAHRLRIEKRRAEHTSGRGCQHFIQEDA